MCSLSSNAGTVPSSLGPPYLPGVAVPVGHKVSACRALGDGGCGPANHLAAHHGGASADARLQ